MSEGNGSSGADRAASPATSADMSVTRALRWKKKPVVIEAFRFRPVFGRIISPCADLAPMWFIRAECEGVATIYNDDEEPYVIIKTLEGNHRADPGDWIIRGVKGELYPCKPDIFELTYELADQSAAEGSDAAQVQPQPREDI